MRNQILPSKVSIKKDAVLEAMANLLDQNRNAILAANQKDIDRFAGEDQTLFDRLKINSAKVDGMILAVKSLADMPDPVDHVLYEYRHPKGMKILNKTAPFGTVMIIYESRPDVTIEAAGIAFKAGNKIILKGGKEAINSNTVLVECWQQALKASGMKEDCIQFLTLNREDTQSFLRNPDSKIDLIIPRGGEALIKFVKREAHAPVLVSGRGNNFLFIHREAKWEDVIPIILNAKTDKISACNALDKVLIDAALPDLKNRVKLLVRILENAQVKVILDKKLRELTHLSIPVVTDPDIWHEEFLDMKIVLGLVSDAEEALRNINRYSGGHSVSILTENDDVAAYLMSEIDAGAVYHNASTRFTDGGEFGLGAEMAISTDKLHHRGPLGLDQLVSNKWYIFGNGQIR